MVITARLRALAGTGLAGTAALAGRWAQTGAEPGIGRRAAQQLARRELSRSVYQPSLTQRILSWLGGRLSGLLSAVNRHVPGGWWALTVLIVTAVLVVTVVLLWVRPATPRRAQGRALLAGRTLSAREHRLLAEQAAQARDYAGAIIERMRAIAVELEERGVLPPAPGRTAGELAAGAGRALPGQASNLRQAAQLFDDVRYGGRDGTAAGYRHVRELDASLQAVRLAGPVLASPVLASTVLASTGPAGPGAPRAAGRDAGGTS